MTERAWHCSRCDVEWETEPGERVPGVCWLCERSDASSPLLVQCGRVVRTASGEPVPVSGVL